MEMNDVFNLPLLTDNRDLVDVNNYIYADFDIDFSAGETHAIAAALAINNHDKLVEALRGMVELNKDPTGAPDYIKFAMVESCKQLLNEINGG